MGRFRYSLLSLLGMVTFLAVGFAALMQATRLWADAVGWASVVTLTWAAIRAFHRSGSVRVFWVTFLFVAGFYLLVVFPSPGVAETDVIFERRTETFLVGVLGLDETAVPGLVAVPDRFLRNLHEKLPHRKQVPVYTLHMHIPEETARVRYARRNSETYVAVPFLIHFRRIGHWFITLILAYAGGCMARWLYVRREMKR
jgi:hypothetical protein